MTEPKASGSDRLGLTNFAPIGTQINALGGQQTINLDLRGTTSESRRGNLPPRPERFVGREQELETIHALLLGSTSNRSTKHPVALVGLAGVGKTALASEYAHQYIDNYEHICWLTSDRRSQSSAFAALADDPLSLGLAPHSRESDRIRAVKAQLEKGGPHLLVFDNIEHVRSWRELLPTGNHTSILITTRREDLSDVRKVAVEVLPEDLALHLLLGQRVWTSEEREAARELCEILGYLTIAVALGSRLIERPAFPPTLLLQRVRQKGTIVWSQHPRGNELLSKNPNLTALFDASVDLLDDNEAIDAHAKRLLWVAGWFAPVLIPRDLFFAAGSHLARTEVPLEISEEAISTLVGLGLSNLDAHGNPSFHRLVADYCRHKSDGMGSSAVRKALAGISDSTWSLAAPIIAPILPHLDYMCGQLVSVDDDWLTFASLLGTLSGQRNQQGRPEEGVDLAEMALRAVTDRDDPVARRVEGALRRNLGQNLQDLGRSVEAETQFRLSAQAHEGGLSDAGFHIAESEAMLGRSLVDLERYDEALALLDRAVATMSRLFHPQLHAALHARAAAHRRLGMYAESSSDLNNALRLQLTLFGPAHHEVAATYNEIGLLFWNQGNIKEAERFFLASLAIKKDIGFRDNHPDVMVTMQNLGHLLLEKTSSGASSDDILKRSSAQRKAKKKRRLQRESRRRNRP